MDLGVTFGYVGERGGKFALGAGVSGNFYPSVYDYVDGYVQLRSSGNPFGLGARLGIPGGGPSQHQLYARYDIELEDGRRILGTATTVGHRFF